MAFKNGLDALRIIAASLVAPRVPYDSVGKVVFLHPHLPPTHDVRNDVLCRWCIFYQQGFFAITIASI